MPTAYPDSWSAIAYQVKMKANWHCIACGDPHSHSNILTVHHLDRDPQNCDLSNLVALCQRCHLQLHGLNLTPAAARARIKARKSQMKLWGG